MKKKILLENSSEWSSENYQNNATCLWRILQFLDAKELKESDESTLDWIIPLHESIVETEEKVDIYLENYQASNLEDEINTLTLSLKNTCSQYFDLVTHKSLKQYDQKSIKACLPARFTEFSEIVNKYSKLFAMKKKEDKNKLACFALSHINQKVLM